MVDISWPSLLNILKKKKQKEKTKQNKENSSNSWTNFTVFRRKTRWRTRKILLDFYSTVLRKIIDVMDGEEGRRLSLLLFPLYCFFYRDDDVNKSFKTFCFFGLFFILWFLKFCRKRQLFSKCFLIAIRQYLHEH